MMLGIVFNLSIWYKLTGKTKYGAYISVGGAVITLIVNFSLIPLIGYTGAAWAHFITYFCMMIASYWLGQKHYPINYDLKKIGFYSFTAIALFAISYYLIPFHKITSHQLLIKTIVNTFILLIYILIIVKKEFKILKVLFKK